MPVKGKARPVQEYAPAVGTADRIPVPGSAYWKEGAAAQESPPPRR